MRLFSWLFSITIAATLAARPSTAEEPTPLAPGTRGLATKAPSSIKIDGKLDEWNDAFCTPLHYSHTDLLNRAAQFRYLWDDRAFYVGLRCLDRRRANVGAKGSLWNGDAVEFYLDTRATPALRGKDWTDGAIHFFFTPFDQKMLKPRWEMRGGIATSGTLLEGVEIAATQYEWGYEIELMIPWKNFPKFEAKAGSLLGIDAELCSGDGGGRTDRTFAYGSPLSVQQPASQGQVELVESFDDSYLPMVCGSALPFWVDVPWVQAERARVFATLAIPPNKIDEIGKVEVRIHDADGKVVETIPARIEAFGPKGKGFARAVATWSIDAHAPNAYFATAKVLSKSGKTLATVAPRMVQEAQMSGR